MYINACISTPEGSQDLWKIPVATYVTRPPNFPSLGENTTISFIMNATSKASVEKMGFYLPDLGFMGGKQVHPNFLFFTDTLWIQCRCHCKQIPNSVTLALPSIIFQFISGLCPLLGGHAEASVSCLQQNTATFLWFLFYAH